jgi:hypothetical protein
MRLAEPLDLCYAPTPEGLGRVIAALAVDPKLMSIAGQALHIADLAHRYGVDVTD